MAVSLAAGLRAAHAERRHHREEHDQDRARRALEEGRALPLGRILKRIRGRLGGDVVGVELKRRDAGYFYELKVVTPSGRLREIWVDAATGEIVDSEDD